MKSIALLLILNLAGGVLLYGQDNTPDDRQRKAITVLIDQYSQARETMDTALLKTILTADVDQLVSTGEWRNGKSAAVEGMLKSSAGSPGTRTLLVDKIRMINSTSAIVDCRYEIQNTDGTIRKMWSSFIVVGDKKTWKITGYQEYVAIGAIASP